MNETKESRYKLPLLPAFQIYLSETRELYDGFCVRYKFENGYEGSIIQHKFSYGNERGLWELAVMLNGHVCYSTPITNDVIGCLDEDGLTRELKKIQALPVSQKGDDNE